MKVENAVETQALDLGSPVIDTDPKANLDLLREIVQTHVASLGFNEQETQNAGGLIRGLLETFSTQRYQNVEGVDKEQVFSDWVIFITSGWSASRGRTLKGLINTVIQGYDFAQSPDGCCAECGGPLEEDD